MLKVGFSSFLVCFTGQHMEASSFASSLFYQLGALVSVPPPKKQTSEGGLCGGQPLMMCSAICSGSSHWQASLSANPHFLMDDR